MDNFDQINQLITLSVIPFSGAHCIALMVTPNSNIALNN